MNPPIFKDEYGIWRDQRPFRSPRRCPDCHRPYIRQTDIVYGSVYHDTDLYHVYGLNWDFFDYVLTEWCCEECGCHFYTQPRIFWDVSASDFEALPILPPEEAEKLLAKWETETSVQAGQLELFG